ncbi:MAG: Npt1/Npt2 family nucleotide transporter [bacterium]
MINNPNNHKSPVELFLFFLLLFFAFFFLISGYALVRSAGASLFIAVFGSSGLPVAMAFEPVMMFVFVYVYSRVLTSQGSRRTAFFSCILTSAVFLISYFVVTSKLRFLDKAVLATLYVFCELYVVIIAEQFWSFVNSTLVPDEARICNGLISAGASAGTIVSSLFMRNMVVEIGTENILLIAAGLMIPVALLIYSAYGIFGEPKPSRKEADGKKGVLHVSLLLKNKILMRLAVIVFLAQVFTMCANLQFFEFVEAAFPQKDLRTAYLADFWMKIGIISLLLDFIVAPLALIFLKPGTIMIIVPCINAAMGILMFCVPSLETAKLCLGTFKVQDYSVFRSAKEIFYIPLDFNARYRAKQIIDSFNYRVSKGISAAGVAVFRMAGGVVSSSGFAAAAVAAAFLWITAAAYLKKEENIAEERV